MRSIRGIFNLAITTHAAREEDYPFGRNGFKIPKENVKKRALRLDEISAIAELTVAPDKLTSKLYFLFMVYANGINFTDLSRLRYSQNVYPERLKFTRKKTNTAVVIRRDNAIDAILKHFYQEGRDYVFPVLDEGMSERQIVSRYTRLSRKVNHDIKQIAKEAGIRNHREVIIYSARHSYAVLDYSLNKDIVATSRALGHTDIKTTQIYLRSLDAEEVEREDRKRIGEFVGVTLMNVS